VIQERLGYYRQNQVHSLEKMLESWTNTGGKI
jgi:hypothetical protein